jgi:phage host-nuclease inhibitor protein Gam
MEGALVGSWVGTGLVFCGLVFTWIKNDKKQTAELGRMEQKVTEFGKKIDDMTETGDELKRVVNEQAVNCARISTRLSTQVENLKETVNKVKRKS